MTVPPRWRLTLALTLACLALAGVLAREWEAWGPSALPAAERPAEGLAAAPASVGTGYSPPARASFEEILRRPLFSPDRRPPPPPPPPEAAPTPMTPLVARLEGIATVGEVRVALVRDLTTNAGLRLAQGMEYQGWKVAAVEADRAILERNGEEQELKLERQ